MVENKQEDLFKNYAKLEEELEKHFLEYCSKWDKFLSGLDEENIIKHQAMIYVLQFAHKNARTRDEKHDSIPIERDAHGWISVKMDVGTLWKTAELYNLTVDYIKKKGGLNYLLEKGLKV